MKRTFLGILLVLAMILCFGCVKADDVGSMPEIELETAANETVEELPQPPTAPTDVYASVMNDYVAWIDGLLTMPKEDFIASELNTGFGNMAIDALTELENPTRDSFGYFLRDLNEDGIDELVLLRDDYYVLGLYTVSEGKPYLLDSFWYRYTGIVLDTGYIYTRGSGGASYTEYKLRRLEKDSTELTVLQTFGVDGETFFVINEDGNKRNLYKPEFYDMLAGLPEHPGTVLEDYYNNFRIMGLKGYYNNFRMVFTPASQYGVK